jgi:taurine dioxygenase
MDISTLEVRPTGGCGAEISGVDVTRATDAQIGLIRDTVFQKGVAFLHDQAMTPDEQIAFAERLGPIVVNRYFPASERYPQIAKVEKAETQKTNIGGGWHTDHSYEPAPAMGSVLLAIKTPPAGGDTPFADMYAAHDALSDGFKQMLGGLKAQHAPSTCSARVASIA